MFSYIFGDQHIETEDNVANCEKALKKYFAEHARTGAPTIHVHILKSRGGAEEEKSPLDDFFRKIPCIKRGAPRKAMKAMLSGP